MALPLRKNEMHPIVYRRIIESLNGSRLRNILAALAGAVLSRLLKRPIIFGMPYVITIEPTNRCNLQCPQCVTGSGQLERETGIMSREIYTTVIDQLAPYACYLLLYNQGEPFLHPQFVRMIAYAKSRKFVVITSTNGHVLYDEHTVNELIESGLDAIIISLDGADAETYHHYRRGGDFDRVVKGIRLLQRMRTHTPAIFLQFLVMKHNETEISAIKRLAKELKVDKLLLKTVQIEQAEDAMRFLPTQARWRRYRSNDSRLDLKHSVDTPCSRLWTGTTVLWDGSVVPCCFDKHGRHVFGTIGTETFYQIWRSQIYETFRKTTLTDRQRIAICRNCSQGQTIYL